MKNPLIAFVGLSFFFLSLFKTSWFWLPGNVDVIFDVLYFTSTRNNMILIELFFVDAEYADWKRSFASQGRSFLGRMHFCALIKSPGPKPSSSWRKFSDALRGPYGEHPFLYFYFLFSFQSWKHSLDTPNSFIFSYLMNFIYNMKLLFFN